MMNSTRIILLQVHFTYYHLHATVRRKVFTRCFTLETYTFGLQNVYVWLAKHVRLADKTCTFGRQNVYVWRAKRVRLAFKITSLDRELTTFDKQRPHVYKTGVHVRQHLKTVYNVKTTNVNKFGRSYSLGKSLAFVVFTL